MMSKKKIKYFINKNYSKKIGRNALERIEKKVNGFMLLIIKKAARKSDFSGRKTIKIEDIE